MKSKSFLMKLTDFVFITLFDRTFFVFMILLMNIAFTILFFNVAGFDVETGDYFSVIEGNFFTLFLIAMLVALITLLPSICRGYVRGDVQ